MNFAASTLSVPEVLLIEAKRFVDERGWFSETWSLEPFSALGVRVDFVQENQSFSSAPGTLRGLHFQRPPATQAKLVRVAHGEVFDVAVDLRPASPTYGQWCGATLSADNGRQLYIPRGFAHGFCTTRPDTIVCYKVDAPYAPAVEGGIRWDDPQLAIPWPTAAAQPVLSPKDAILPAFKDFIDCFEALA